MGTTAIGRMFNRRKNKTPLDQCLNCGTKLGEGDAYCPKCGQKAVSSKVTIWGLIAEFFTTVFNLDNSIWRSLVGLIKPAFLSKEFISGKRKKYLHPLRLFFITLVVQFTLIAAFIKSEDISGLSNEPLKELAVSDFYDDFSAIRDTISSDSIVAAMNLVEDTLFKGVKHTAQDSFGENFKFLQVDMSEYPMLKQDFYELAIDSLMRKYDVKTFQERLVIGQYIRARRDLPGAVRFFVGNMIWSVILTIFLLALTMKLLYLGKKKYYVEHVVVLSNIHSFSFIVVSLTLIPSLITGDWLLTASLSGFSSILIVIYFIWTLKSYYNQGFLMTLLYFLILGFSYIMLISFMILLVLIVSMMMF